MMRSAPWFTVAAMTLVAVPACDRDRAAPAGAGTATGEEPGQIGGSMILATTTSTRDSGLLDLLVPLFEEQTGVEVKVIAVGTGAALEMARRGDADAVLVHAPESEQTLVRDGHLVSGRRVMHNDFVLVGPPDDPARLRDAGDLADAMKRLAESGLFVSRGDDSGTHKRELALWKKAGIGPSNTQGPQGRRVETGQGMGATLHIADERDGYTLTDRGTFLAHRKRLKLAILFEGAAEMLNIYHVHVVRPAVHPEVKRRQAEAFVSFLTSEPVQRRIGRYRANTYGEPLFIPDALPSASARPHGSAQLPPAPP